MPRYEFYCEDFKKPLEITLTLVEHEKGNIKCPKCGGKRVHQEAASFVSGASENAPG